MTGTGRVVRVEVTTSLDVLIVTGVKILNLPGKLIVELLLGSHGYVRLVCTFFCLYVSMLCEVCCSRS